MLRPTSFDGWVGDEACEVRAMLTQIDRYKEHFASIKFQRVVTTLYKEQEGIIVLTSAGKKSEFVAIS